MRELIELGIDTSKASMCWILTRSGVQFLIPNEENSTLGVTLENDFLIDQYIPTFTLQDIIEILPKEITYHTKTEWNGDIHYFLHLGATMNEYDWKSHQDHQYHICYYNQYYEDIEYLCDIKTHSLLEAAFNMLKWCKQNNYI